MDLPQGAIGGILPSAMERLLRPLPFTGRVSVVLQNGRVAEVRLRGRLLPPAHILEVRAD